MTPLKTWNMCKPVRPKNDAPNSGEPHGLLQGRTPSPIRCSHSRTWRTINATPPSIVNSMNFTTAVRSPRFDAETASAIVRLEVSRQNVMKLAKAIDGHIGNGVGQLLLA